MFEPDKYIAAIAEATTWDAKDASSRYRKKQMLKSLKNIRSSSIKNEASKLKNYLVEEKGKCEICGFSYKPVLQIHHILPISEYGNNAKDNVMCLCPNCHKTLHTIYKGNFDIDVLMSHFRSSYGDNATTALVSAYIQYVDSRTERIQYFKMMQNLIFEQSESAIDLVLAEGKSKEDNQ